MSERDDRDEAATSETTLTIQEVGIALQRHDRGWLPIARQQLEQTWEHGRHGCMMVRRGPDGGLQFRAPWGRPVFSEWQQNDWRSSPAGALLDRCPPPTSLAKPKGPAST